MAKNVELQILLEALYNGRGIDRALDDLVGLAEILEELGNPQPATAQLDELNQKLDDAGMTSQTAAAQLQAMGSSLPVGELGEMDIRLAQIGQSSQDAQSALLAMSGNIPTNELNQFEEDLINAGRAADHAGKQIEDAGTRASESGDNAKVAQNAWNDFGSQMIKVNQTFEGMQQVVGMVGNVFTQTFELAEQGEAIRQTEQKLAALSGEINTTANALMMGLRQATRGTVDDLALMQGAITFLNMGFVDSQQAVEDLMQKIILLKSPTDSVSDAINDFSLMLANQSVERLDAFGLSSGRVRSRIDELTSSAEGLSRAEAFVIATMESMDVAIERQGLSTDDLGNSYQRLRVQVENMKQAFQNFLAEGLSPVANAMAGDNAMVARQIIAQNIALADSMDDLAAYGAIVNEQFHRWGGFAPVITGTNRVMADSINQIAERMAQQSDSMQEFLAIFEETFGWRAQQYFDLFLQGLGMTTEQWYDYLKATQYVSSQQEQVLEQVGRASDYYNTLLGSVDAVTVEIGRNTAATDRKIGIDGTALGLMERYNQAVAQHPNLLRELTAQTVVATGASETYVASVRELNAEFGGAVVSTLNQFVELTPSATAETQNWTAALLEQAAQSGINREQLLMLMEATGEFTDEQIQAALKTAAMSEKVAELAQQLANGKISVDDAVFSLQTFEQQLEADYRIAIDASEIDAAIERSRQLQEQLQSIEAGQYDTPLSPPGPSSGGGQPPPVTPPAPGPLGVLTAPAGTTTATVTPAGSVTIVNVYLDDTLLLQMTGNNVRLTSGMVSEQLGVLG